MCMEKQEKKERKILTENRMTTVNKRETSFEGLAFQMENGEDGVYNLVRENDKNVIFAPKISITKKDLEEIPPLRQLREAIDSWEAKLKVTEGRDAYIIKKALIEMRKDQYIIKQEFRKPVQVMSFTPSRHSPPLDEEITVDEEGVVTAKGVSLLNPEVVSVILCNYSKFKQDVYDQLTNDLWYLMKDFDHVSDIALADYPMYERIVDLKIDGKQNAQIQEILEQEFGVKHSVEYISSLWRKKIPQLIASTAEDLYLDYYYLNVEKGKYKKCSRCGQIKLAINKNFSKNKTSKDNFYSICKKCRNKKKGDE